MFDLPPGLTRLIAAGVWPSAAGPSMNAQQLRPTIPAERVRLFAEEESLICLQPPPFHTIAQERAAGGASDFWEKSGALDQIDPERAVIIGDFGLGSDSPIVLDFARDGSKPPVLRLRWGPRGVGNAWVLGARDFDEFAALLGLAPGQSRVVRRDPVAGKRMRNAVYVFALVMFGMFAALAWSILTAENGQAKDAPSLAICIMMLLVFGASVNVFVAYGKLCWWYRCPQCGARIPRPPETKVGDPIRYRCTACDVEWDTGWEVAAPDNT